MTFMRLATAVICCLMPAALAGQDAGTFLGTWKMDVQRSTGQNNQARLIQFTKLADGRILYTMTVASSQGDPLFTQAVLRINGESSPLYQTQDLADWLERGTPTSKKITVRLTRPDRMEFAIAPSGTRRIFTVSADGKTIIEETENGQITFDKVH